MIKKYSLPIFLLLLIVVPVSSVSAQTTSTKRPNQPVRVAQDAMEMKPATATAEMRQRAATASGTVRERVASRSATLKDKLAAFKDKRKAAAIERISTNITNVNQRRTSAMMQHIDALSGILTKAEDRVTAAQAAGADVSAITTELGLSKTAIANAKTAVGEQAKKTYEIEIATESGAKATVKETRDMFEQDLKATHSLVKEARRVLINALTKLGQSMGGGAPTNGTN